MKFTEPHTIMTNWLPLKSDLGWLPNKAGVTRIAERALSALYGR